MVSCTIHDQAYEVYSWPEVGTHTFSLGLKIRKSKRTFDRVIALARGGVSIAQSLADLLGVHTITVIQTQFYTGIETQAKTPKITQPLTVSVAKERVLLVDDLADSGETLLFVKNYLEGKHPQEVKIATLATKPWTKLPPDFWVLRSEAWIVFPWEVRETITTVSALWAKAGDQSHQIRKNLQTLGYTDLEIDSFYHP